MEAIAALGLASNVLQFIDFARELLKTYGELCQGPSVSDYEYHRAIAIHLSPIANKIGISTQAVAQSSSNLSSEQKAIRLIADRCCELAANLQKRLRSCGIPLQQNAGRIKRAGAALRVLWGKSEIESMLKQLDNLRNELNLHLNFEIWRVRQMMSDSQLNFQNYAANHRIQVLQEMSKSNAANSQMHANTIQQVTSGRTAVDQGFERLEDLLRRQHSEVANSIATVQAQDSQFHATLTCESQSIQNSMKHVLRSLMEEYSEDFLEKTRKEFRGTARAEFQRLFDNLEGPAMTTRIEGVGEVVRCMADAKDALSADGKDYMLESRHSPLPAVKEGDEEARERSQKGAFAIDGQEFYSKVTRLGTFLVRIKRFVHFPTNRPSLSVYEVDASFIPAAGWLAAGMAVNYSRTIDGRGSPRFGFQLTTFRVLDDDHEVWSALAVGDISTIRSMLSQRTIFPSDRDDHGNTLLHMAALYNWSAICKSLIQSGADALAENRFGYTPMTYCLSPNRKPLFYFMCSVNNTLDFFWDTPIQLDTALYMVLGNFVTTMDQEITGNFQSQIHNWLSMYQGIDVLESDPNRHSALDGDIAGRIMKFLMQCVLSKGTGRYHGPIKATSPEVSVIYQRAVQIFDVLVDRWVASRNVRMCHQVPTWRAAFLLARYFDGERRMGRVRRLDRPQDESCPTEPVVWYNYRIHRSVLYTIKLLEHMILVSIKQQPDSIFDLRESYTAHEMLMVIDLGVMWTALLSECGIDPIWVEHETQRRRATGIGESSAHEIKVRQDASQIQTVAKRKAFKSTESQ